MPSLSYATAQGARPYQQDRYLVEELPRGHLLAVMDGHGERGDVVAEKLKAALRATFEPLFQKHPESVETALRETIARLAQEVDSEESGSTLSVAFIPREANRVVVGVVGDSPVITQDLWGKIRCSPLHNARSNPEERSAAVARGARYIGGYLEAADNPGPGLQMSRALGDHGLTTFLNREPDMYSVDLGKESFVLIASDGIFDAFDRDIDEQVKKIGASARKGMDAIALVEDAVRRQTMDNVTVVIWRS